MYEFQNISKCYKNDIDYLIFKRFKWRKNNIITMIENIKLALNNHPFVAALTKDIILCHMAVNHEQLTQIPDPVDSSS